MSAPHFTCDAELLSLMQKKSKPYIVVEVATSNASDFEVSEIFLRLCTEAHASYLTEKKRYKMIPGDGFHVLLPPYRLSYDPEIRFFLKHFLFIRTLSFTGIHL